ncbi:alpha/beta hydrolase [Sphingomonas psychrotolerans]|uniref:Alpha/beta hydrolase n=1 Tax=Sphingomonas psychrotolerans TaxID=1327635 RepID=A0ABU3NAN9_9SPHN|nr:alpha/beta hydrolase [Sphingomonas psychrotolerans]MDT8760862.1 alpha/beta hydrolase [Sphingomonas psychrotolerans]
MKFDRRSALLAGLAAPLAARAQTAPPHSDKPLPPGLADPAETIDLWPKGVPGKPATLPVETVDERSTIAALTDRSVTGVANPRMAVFRPRLANGASVLITPGGGYSRIVLDHEGYVLGRWLAAQGFAAYVLFYRLPGDGWKAGPDVALSDAQRAMRLIRARAIRDGLDPERVAAIGFSAGGHLCADLATRHAAKTYDPVDAADRLGARPFLAAPIYPVISMRAPVAHMGSRERLIGKDASAALEAAHSPDRNVSSSTPPCFLVHAEDDDVVPVENSLLFRAALKAAGVPVETHLFTAGGHGFGMTRAVGKPAGIWPELFLTWAHSQGLA